MINCKFSYNKELLNKIANNTSKKFRIIMEICLVIIAIAVVSMFVLEQIVLGVSFSVMFVAVTFSAIMNIRAINKSNSVLIGREMNITFGETEMEVKVSINNKEISSSKIAYNVIKDVRVVKDLVYYYINRSSAIIVPKQCFASEQDCTKSIELATNNYIVK